MRAPILSIVCVLLSGVLSLSRLSACIPQPVESEIPDSGAVLTSVVQTVEYHSDIIAVTSTAAREKERLITEIIETEKPADQTQPEKNAIPDLPAQYPDRAKLVSSFPGDSGRYLKNTGFTASWEVENTGSTAWTKDYQIIFFSGDRIGTGLPFKYKLGSRISPGDRVTIDVNMVAGNSTGEVHSIWVLANEKGVYFFPLNTRIEVVDKK
jgi:hypothetical protein